MPKSIHKIVITGGPCGGKTSGIGTIQEEMSDRGYKVLVVSEVPTEIITGGASIGENALKNIDFQKAILSLQIAKEKVFEKMAENMPQEKVLIICDRGALDGKAYCSKEEYQKIMCDLNLNETVLRDEYDAVFHLKTTADGAEDYYTLENNAARSESPELARMLDEKTIQAWTGHPYLRVIENQKEFSSKMFNLVKEMCRFLGEPVPSDIQRKFLIKMPDIDALLNKFKAAEIDIIQTYLKSDIEGVEHRIRQRGANGDYVYSLTTKMTMSDGSYIPTQRRISNRDYLTLLMSADTSLRPIRKKRYCFVYNSLYFELDVYPFWNDKAILEIKLTEENQEIALPEYVKVIKEVTNDIAYRNVSLAKAIPE